MLIKLNQPNFYNPYGKHILPALVHLLINPGATPVSITPPIVD